MGRRVNGNHEYTRINTNQDVEDKISGFEQSSAMPPVFSGREGPPPRVPMSCSMLPIFQRLGSKPAEGDKPLENETG